MAKITIRIREDRVNKKGLAPIELLVFHKGRNKQLSLGRKVKPENWDDERKEVKGEGRQVTNSVITRQKAKLQNIIDKMILAEEDLSLDEIVRRYRGKSQSEEDLAGYLQSYIDRNPENLQYGTLKYYKTCLERIKEFDKVKLKHVNEDWLGGFEKFLKKEGNNQNTIFQRLKVIRKIMRLAQREGKVQHYPFQHYKIKTEKTTRDFLSLEELKKLQGLEGLPKSYELVRDVYVFSATTGGIRFGDLCVLQRDSIKDGKISFRNRKTKDPISFRLSKTSQAILDKYSGDYLFPIIDDSKPILGEISRRNAYFNKVLKLLAQKAKINKRLTMHTARHTWATISLNNDISTEVVGKILGHKDLKTTQIYTNILDKRKDEAIDRWDDILG